LGLARAIAQHLRSGGFSYSQIAKLMGISAGAAEMRCRSGDMRSVVTYEEAEGLNAA
jgi:DNA-directed RNA polymerase specialized sigma24 family protein